jgi:hypothetical protein
MQKVPIELVKPGMVLATTVCNDSGMALCGEGTELTDTIIERLKRMNVTHLVLKGVRWTWERARPRRRSWRSSKRGSSKCGAIRSWSASWRPHASAVLAGGGSGGSGGSRGGRGLSTKIQHLKILARRVQSLPTLPQVVQKLMDWVESPDVSPKDLGKLISTDQVLGARVLRLVNSPSTGSRAGSPPSATPSHCSAST